MTREMVGQISIFDIFDFKPTRELAEVVAEKMNANSDLIFNKTMDTGYYLLFVAEKDGHRFVIDGTNKNLGFGIDNFFIAHKGYDDIKTRYEEWRRKR
jgi:hypothetical protein